MDEPWSRQSMRRSIFHFVLRLVTFCSLGLAGASWSMMVLSKINLDFFFQRGVGVWESSSGFLSIWSLSDSYIRVPLLMKVSSGLLPSLSLVSLEHFPRLVAIASGKHIVLPPSLLLYPCKDPHI